MLNLHARARQRGLSIVELMVGITVGLIVLLGASGMYLGASRSGQDSVRANRLNQDLRAVMDIMVSDIRRAGFFGNAAGGTVNPFTGTATNISVKAGLDCILYTYDATWNGSVPGTINPGVDFAGFRLSGGAVQVLNSTTLNDTGAACADQAWENLTDPSVLEVTALRFDYADSKCIVFDPQTYRPTVPATYGDWSVPSDNTAGNTHACDTAMPAPFPSGFVPAAGNSRAEARQVRIRITARHTADATLVRGLEETVQVRNHRVITP